jgi:hypothetical protein
MRVLGLKAHNIRWMAVSLLLLMGCCEKISIVSCKVKISKLNLAQRRRLG